MKYASPRCVMVMLVSLAAPLLAQAPADKPKPPDKPNRVQAALKREQARDPAGAMKLLGEEISANADNAEARFHRGRIGLSGLPYQPNLRKQVEADFNKALELRPKEAAWWAMRGEFHSKAGNPAQAVADFTEALKLKPDQTPWLLSRGLAYGHLGKLAEAARDNEAAAKLKPDFAFAWINATDVYVQMNDAPSALRTGEQAIKVAGNIPMAQLNCGRAYLLDRQFVKAQQHFDQALQLHATFPQAYFYRAQVHSALNDLLAARDDYQSVVTLDPGNAQSALALAKIALAFGSVEQAVDICERLRKLAPTNAEFHLEAAEAWAALEDTEQAFAALNQAAANKELLAEIESVRGDLLWQQGDTAGARKAYEASLAAYDQRVSDAPENFDLRHARAVFLANHGQAIKALPDLQAAAAKDPRDHAALNALAWLYATSSLKETHNAPAAVDLATNACTLTLDRNDLYLDTKAAALAAAGSYEEAIRVQKLALAGATSQNAVQYRQRLLAYSKQQPWRKPTDVPTFSVRIRPEPIDPSLEVAKFAALAPGAAPKEKELADVIAGSEDAVVLLQHEAGGGSGMILSEAGHVLTCAHVLPPRGTLSVVFERLVGEKRVSTTRPADIVAVDHVRDLALVQIREAPKLPTVRLGLAAKPRAGEKVVVIGNPGAGGGLVLKRVAADGIVSNAAQPIGVHKIQNRIQTSATVSPGCSGGPLLNMQGEVIGVVVSSVDVARAGFAVPMTDVAAFLGVKIEERK